MGSMSAWGTDYPYSVGSSTSDAYGTAFSPEYILTGNGSVDITFTNYRQESTDYWCNWVLMCATSSEVSATTDLTNKIFTVRSDWYDDKAGSNASFTSGNGYTNDDFRTFQNEATVNIKITRVGKLVTVYTTVTKDEETRWMSYYKSGVTDETLKFYLTQQLSYLTITSEPTIAAFDNTELYTYAGTEDVSSQWSINGKSGYTHSFTSSKGTSPDYYGQLYTNVNASRNATWNLGVSESISDNFVMSFKFQIATNASTSLAVIGANATTSAVTANPSNAYLRLTYDGSSAFNTIVGTTDISSALTLSNSTWYTTTLTLLDGDKASPTLLITINDGSSDILNTTRKVSTTDLGALKGLFVLHGKGGTVNFDDVTVTKYTQAGVCSDPTYEITAPDGTNRKFTLACETAESTCYYSTTELEAGDAGWTEYTGEVSTAAATIYAYAKTDDANSSVISFVTGAGTAITLNAPSLSKTAYADGKYTVSISHSQSGLEIVPASSTVYYSINGGAATTYSSAFAVTEGSTVSAYVSADGYTTSSTTELSTTARPDFTEVWSQNYKNVTSAAGTGTQALTLATESFTAGERTFYNITAYGETPTAVDLDTHVGLNTNDHFYLRCNGSNSGILQNSKTQYIGLQNLTVGQYIICTTNGFALSAEYGVELQEGMSTTSEYIFKVTSTSASIVFPNGTYNYLYVIGAYTGSVSATIGATGYSTFASNYALDLANLPDGLTAYYASEVGTSSVTLTEVTDAVPAGTGLVLKGTASTAYSIPFAASGTAIEGNKLVGCTTSTALNATSTLYVLVNNEGTAEFQSLADNGATIPAGKAYLNAGTSGARLSIVFADDATGIKSVEGAKQAAGEYYNLSGQRVVAPTKGLYIVNGKKVIIK